LQVFVFHPFLEKHFFLLRRNNLIYLSVTSSQLDWFRFRSPLLRPPSGEGEKRLPLAPAPGATPGAGGRAPGEEPLSLPAAVGLPGSRAELGSKTCSSLAAGSPVLGSRPGRQAPCSEGEFLFPLF